MGVARPVGGGSAAGVGSIYLYLVRALSVARAPPAAGRRRVPRTVVRVCVCFCLSTMTYFVFVRIRIT